MNPSASLETGSTHPLSGLEGWPKSGPIYGLAEQKQATPGGSFWQRLGERFRKSPPGDLPAHSQARIWY